MKAWYVNLNDCDSAYVLAETRGKATMAAIREWEGWAESWDRDYWKAVRCRRFPALDGDSFTERQLVDGGHIWTRCHGCGGFAGYCGPADGLVYGADNRPYCEEACRDRPTRPGVPLYTSPVHGPYEPMLVSTEY